MYTLKLVIEKFEILKAMNLLVKSMNNEDAYEEWVYTVPDEASDDDLMYIAADEDETVYLEACQVFRRICHNYLDDGIFAGCYPGEVKLYGAKKDDPYEEEDNE